MNPRVLVVTDSDSYVKWGAALAGRMPTSWEPRLVVVRGSALPGERQIAEALHGSRFSPGDVERADRPTLRRMMVDERPDVVIAAARGMTVETVLTMMAGVVDRPVLATGLPGVSFPPKSHGLKLRQGCDVFVLHSRREVTEHQAMGVPHRYELARLPFLDPRADDLASDGPRDRIVFAAQAVVPATLEEREWLLGRLVETARKQPDLDVVIKLRAHPGEPQTHVEQFSFADLLGDLDDVPPNLRVDVGSMSEHLRRAVGFVTVSSTAALEAVAAGVPTLVLDDFGVGAEQINLVFEGSGLIGSTDDLVRGDFRTADPAWLDDNYLHPPEDDTWVAAIEELVELRATEGLPPVVQRDRSLPSRIRREVYERLAFAGPTIGPLQRAYVKAASWQGRRHWRRRRPDGAAGRGRSTRGTTRP